MDRDAAMLGLASYRNFLQRGQDRWTPFLAKRHERLVQWERQGRCAEKVAENILEDLLTDVLDWNVSDINNQVDYADIVVTHFGLKRLVLEIKRPGALAWNRHALDVALEQACRYAAEQEVDTVAASDGFMFYAANIESGGRKDRIYVSLNQDSFPADLWWISRDGIYRPRPGPFCISSAVLPPVDPDSPGPCSRLVDESLLHAKYKLPAFCFAYVGQADRPSSWKLPFRKADLTVDEKRLPKAIQCILSNYRGARVGGVPESAVADVLVRLAGAAAEIGKMPRQFPATAEIYQHLAKVLKSIGRLEES